MTSSTVSDRTRVTSHSVVVEAAAPAVYRLIAEIERWPFVFAPTVHVDRLAAGDDRERLRIWALANGQVRSWESERELDPVNLRVSFQQVVSAAPVESMSGEWVLERVSPTSTRVVLLHHFTTLGDDPDDTALITAAVDRNSDAELAALKAVAELGPAFDDRVLTFSDSVVIDAAPSAVYDFLYRADLWPQRLPHVSRLELREPEPGVQSLTMDTRAADGSVHTTRSMRVCSDPERIVYKQTHTPPIMSAHVGAWVLERQGTGTRVTSHHTVVVQPAAIADVLGPGGTLDTARALIRRSLGTNSLATLGRAKQATEAPDGR